jgi:hypothetical protein
MIPLAFEFELDLGDRLDLACGHHRTDIVPRSTPDLADRCWWSAVEDVYPHPAA